MAQITVGIPARKTDFLVQAISSVLSQTLTDFELLISDDSPDGSVSELVRRFQDPRIRLIEGPRQGAVANCVHIWENAACDLLKYVYDDDLLYPTALAHLATLLAKDQRYVFAFSRREVIDAFGRVLRRPEAFVTDDWVWFEPCQITEFLGRNVSNPAGELGSLLIRRSAFPDASCLSACAGLPIRSRPELAFLMSAAERGSSVATGADLGASRDAGGPLKGPAHSRSLIEWELCIRGGVQRGVISHQGALRGLPNLATLYHQGGEGYSEVHLIRRHLPQLKELLGTGARELITEQFFSDLDAMNTLIEMREAQAGATPEVPADAPEVSRVHGRVDGLTRRTARGWAWIPEEPERRVRVEAVVGERVVGHAIAEKERRDLAKWRTGEGDYGFEMTFYEALLTDEAPRFRVSADADEWLPLEAKLPPLGERRTTAGAGARAVLAEHARFTEPGPAFEEFDWEQGKGAARLRAGADPLVMAFYLPQFHAIPENNRSWGQGFTEWRQLARAAPRFPGHYQPRIPRDMGFYDLLDEDVIRRQSQMARAAGVGAFAFYYYWFNKKRVLERPVEIFRKSDIEMPFLLIWANENWTRTWDGSEHEVLLEQDYRPEHEDALLEDLATQMLDPRYVRLDGRPLFVIYNPDPIPDTARTIARWREAWNTRFGLNPLIFMAQTFHREDPRTYGLDGAMEFPPHKLANHAPRRDVLDAFAGDFAGQVMAYDDFVTASLKEPATAFPLIKTALPGWDNDARRPNRGLLLENSTPAKYQAWLQALVEKAIERPIHGVPLVAVNAWNEWAEGAYLEPDVHYGSAYLNATSRAIRAAIEAKNETAPAPLVRPSAGSGGRKRIFLHVGQHKTGTTSIQGALAAQRDELADCGVLYPETGCPEWADLAQHLLPWSVLRRPEALPALHEHKANFAAGDADRLWERLHAEIASAGADTVVISSEEFDVLDGAEIKAVGARLDRYDVTPVIFLRRTSHVLESNYRTSVIHMGYEGDIRAFAQASRSRTDAHGMVCDWRSIARDGEAVIVSYDEPDAQRDAVAAFLRAIGLEVLAARTGQPQARLNRSSPAFICEIARFLRQGHMDEASIDQWRREIEQVHLPADSSERYTCLPADLEAELDADYAREAGKLTADPETARMLRGSLKPARSRETPATVDSLASALVALGHEIRLHQALAGRAD
jgi:glycosyl transferase family WbsX/glycosyl transferase family 2